MYHARFTECVYLIVAMAASTIRISEQSHRTLRQLADERGTSMQVVLDEAIERLRRAAFFESVNAAYERLRADPEAWAEIETERRALEGTLLDGLEDDPYNDSSETG